MTQDTYLAILFDDLGFSVKGRKGWLKAEYGVEYVDELLPLEKSRAIERLKEMKETRKGENLEYDDDGI